MIKPEDVYKIGRLGKAHGVKGEVSFQFDSAPPSSRAATSISPVR